MNSTRTYCLTLVSLVVVSICNGLVQSASALTVSGEPQGDTTVNGFDIFEVGIKLDEGQQISYAYSATTPMLFMLHRHEGSDVITYYQTEKKDYNDAFTAPKTGDYYLLWENMSTTPNDLTYHVSIPQSVNHINYNGTNFDVEVVSNSSVRDMQFDSAGQLTFTVETPYLTPGFAMVTVPDALLSGELSVKVSGSKYSVSHDGTSSQIDLKIPVGTQEITIHGTHTVPEFEYAFVVLSIAVVMLSGWRFLKMRFKY